MMPVNFLKYNGFIIYQTVLSTVEASFLPALKFGGGFIVGCRGMSAGGKEQRNKGLN